MLSRELSPIDWSRDAQTIHNQIRGLNPWPSATTALDGKTLKIHGSRVGGNRECAKPGENVGLAPLAVFCGNGATLENRIADGRFQKNARRRFPAWASVGNRQGAAIK